MSDIFECCHKCTAPKRHPGCHASCEEYLKAKAEFERIKQESDPGREYRLYSVDKISHILDRKAKENSRTKGYRTIFKDK
jgi:hypothetical protein